MNPIHIGDRPVGPNEPTFVIAEAGSNHNGDLTLAEDLVDVAADAGADAVKFQTFRADDLYVEESGGVDYLDDDRSIYEIIEDMEMPYEWIPELHDHCQKRDIYFMSTPFDERSAGELAEYVPAFKIASYTISHHPFLEHVAGMDKPVIMSTGAHELDEVRESVGVFDDLGFEELFLLQCVAAYPTPLESINVRVVETLREEFSVLSGLSDHTLNPTVAPTAAVSLGASVIEKHFTLDKSMEGPDHQFALEPDELEKMVAAIRDTERALGSGEKTVIDVEEELHQKARRGIHANGHIDAGQVITDADVKVLRPGAEARGLHPKFYNEVVGSRASRTVPNGKGIEWDDLET